MRSGTRTEVELTLRFIFDPTKAIDPKELQLLDSAVGMVRQMQCADPAEVSRLENLTSRLHLQPLSRPTSLALAAAGAPPEVIQQEDREYLLKKTRRTVERQRAAGQSVTVPEGFEWCLRQCGRLIVATSRGRRQHDRHCQLLVVGGTFRHTHHAHMRAN